MVHKAIVLVLTLTSVWLIIVCSFDTRIRLFEAGDRTLGRGDCFLSIVAFDRTLSCRYRARTPWSPSPNLDLERLFANRLPTMQKIWQFDRYGVRILQYPMKVGLCQKFSDERIIPLGPEATETDLSIKIPLWMPTVLAAVYPLWAFIRGPFRRSRRQRKRSCMKCGYDLAGNVSGICPECGWKLPRRFRA